MPHGPVGHPRIRTLQWGVGTFCIVIGAMILVAPQQFGYFAGVGQPGLFWRGGAFLLAGTGLVAAAALATTRPFTGGVHVLAGVVLVVIALGFGSTGAVTGAIVYGLLGLGTAVAPFLRRIPMEPTLGGDAFALVVAASSTVLGGAFLAQVDQVRSPLLTATPGLHAGFGVFFLGGGLALLVVQLRPAPRLVVWAGHLIVGITYCSYATLFAVPIRAWTGIAYYDGFGIVIALLPWLAPVLERVDPSSLRTRLALTLIAAASLPLLISETASADQAERIVVAQASTEQQVHAAAASQNIQYFVQGHLAAASTVATRANLLSLTADQQRAVLRSLIASDVFAFSTFDADGRPVARSDELALAPIAPSFIDDMRHRGAAVQIIASPQLQRPIFAFGAPMSGAGGQIGGFVVAEVEPARVEAELSRFDPNRKTGTSVFLVDASGHLIAHPDPSLMVALADFSRHPAVAAVLATEGSGALRYPTDSAGEQLAGYAWVPGVGWGVVVERPLALTLASIYADRNLTFESLLVAIAVAAVFGLLVADRVAAPLRTLAAAVNRLTEGDAVAPLPRSGISDVARLAELFGHMRDRLSARTLERERAEANLRMSEERYRQIVETAHEGIWTLDRDGITTYVNQRMAAMLGWSVTDMMGTSPFPLIEASHRVNRAPTGENDRAVIDAPPDVKLQRKDGSDLWVAIATNPLVDDRGESAGALWMVSDVTTRRRAEDALRFLAEASSTLASSLDYKTTLTQVAALAVPDLADWCTVDMLDDDVTMRRVAAAHADSTKVDLLYEVLRRYPVHLDEPRGAAIAVRTGQSDVQPDLTDADLQTVARDPIHLGMLRELGPRSHLIVPLEVGGRRLGALSFSHGPSGRRYTVADLPLADDLARRAAAAIDNARLYQEARTSLAAARAAEDQVRSLNADLESRVVERTAQLQETNKELEAFSYSVAHDLRAPLRAIVGFSRILEEDYAAMFPLEAGELLGFVRSNALQMGQLIDDLLAFSRLSRQPLRRQAVVMTDLVQQVFADLRSETDGRQVDLRIGDLPPCQADPTLLGQVWINLLSNALKFTRTRETAMVEINWRRDGEETVYFVKDNGVGFDLAYAAKLFTVFQRLHQPEEFEGTGVGLAIVQRIVHRHGGRVWAEASRDRGATFFFTLGGLATDD